MRRLVLAAAALLCLAMPVCAKSRAPRCDRTVAYLETNGLVWKINGVAMRSRGAFEAHLQRLVAAGTGFGIVRSFGASHDRLAAMIDSAHGHLAHPCRGRHRPH